MPSFVYTSLTVLVGTAWTGTAPGTASTPSGTISSSTDISQWVKSAPFEAILASVENTAMGSGGFVSVLPGLLSATFSIDANDGFSAGEIDAVLWPWLTGRNLVYFDLKPTSSARSTSNPSVVFAGYLGSVPVGGGIGQAAGKSFQVNVTGAYTRLTS